MSRIGFAKTRLVEVDRIKGKNSSDYLVSTVCVDGYKFVHSRGIKLPDYQVVKVTGKSHQLRFTVDVLIGDKVAGSGVGNNKSQAEECAATKALETLL
mgnify:CR=1 FL=1